MQSVGLQTCAEDLSDFSSHPNLTSVSRSSAKNDLQDSYRRKNHQVVFFSNGSESFLFFYMARSSVDDIPGKGVLSLHQPITPSALVSGRHYQHICCKMISCNGATRRRDGCGFTGLGRFWSTHCRPSNNFGIWAAVKKKR